MSSIVCHPYWAEGLGGGSFDIPITKGIRRICGTALSYDTPILLRSEDSSTYDDATPFWSPNKLADRALALFEQVSIKLDEDINELQITEGIVFDSKIRDKCIMAVSQMAQILALANELKLGAFAEEDGSISLVAQSLVTDRRVSLHFTSGQKEFQVVRVDEQMCASASWITPSDIHAFGKIAKWVTAKL